MRYTKDSLKEQRQDKRKDYMTIKTTGSTFKLNGLRVVAGVEATIKA
nr:MAG TPA: hypothetical protein [Caudoviricetes sp.]DAL04043.1 MAG TPA: hypothetical protein [Caudoviricetes sp.]DAP10735.1 MAG TPA: hypothetical protein [Caudoviricetes sp.]DAS36845.1 MAG TPA: hypothetical protein [Caudoviricetes sp.]DAX72375.1 MAG TPA: hypothetical protein [Caudoviricetes sp.]